MLDVVDVPGPRTSSRFAFPGLAVPDLSGPLLLLAARGGGAPPFLTVKAEDRIHARTVTFTWQL